MKGIENVCHGLSTGRLLSRSYRVRWHDTEDLEMISPGIRGFIGLEMRLVGGGTFPTRHLQLTHVFTHAQSFGRPLGGSFRGLGGSKHVPGS